MSRCSGLPRVAVILAVFASMGCTFTGEQGRFALLSARKYKSPPPGKSVTGSACTKIAFGVQTDPGYMQRAMDDALGSAGPKYDTLVNTTMKRKWLLGVDGIFTYICYEVSGTAIASGKDAVTPVSDPEHEEQVRARAVEDENAGLVSHGLRALFPGPDIHPAVADNYFKAALVGSCFAPVGGQLWAPRVFYGAPEGESVTPALLVGAASLISPLVHVACLLPAVPMVFIPPALLIYVFWSQLLVTFVDMQIQTLLISRTVAHIYSSAYKRSDRAADTPAAPPAKQPSLEEDPRADAAVDPATSDQPPETQPLEGAPAVEAPLEAVEPEGADASGQP